MLLVLLLLTLATGLRPETMLGSSVREIQLLRETPHAMGLKMEQETLLQTNPQGGEAHVKTPGDSSSRLP